MRGRGAGEPGEGQVGLPRREHHAVEAVDPLAVVAAGLHHLGDDAGELVEVGEGHVPQLDVRGHPLQRDPQPGGVAERAVGVGERVEQVVTGADRADLPVAAQDVHLEHRLVRQPVAERRRLDAEPGDRSPERDGAQLRHHLRDEAARQRDVDEVLVGAHPLHVGGAGLLVDRDDAAETGDVEPGRVGAGAGPEEVGGVLGQTHGCVRGYGVVRRREPANRLRVPVMSYRIGHVSNLLPDAPGFPSSA